MREPTAEECSTRARWDDPDGKACMALWWPQMGGYSGRALVVAPYGENPCLEVYVWHDGEFPFGDGRDPVNLHICEPEQWTQLGTQLAEFQKALDPLGEARMTYKVTESDGSARQAIQEMREARAQLCNKVLKDLSEFESVWGVSIHAVDVLTTDVSDMTTGGLKSRVYNVLVKVQL